MHIVGRRVFGLSSWRSRSLSDAPSSPCRSASGNTDRLLSFSRKRQPSAHSVPSFFERKAMLMPRVPDRLSSLKRRKEPRGPEGGAGLRVPSNAGSPPPLSRTPSRDSFQALLAKALEWYPRPPSRKKTYVAPLACASHDSSARTSCDSFRSALSNLPSFTPQSLEATRDSMMSVSTPLLLSSSLSCPSETSSLSWTDEARLSPAMLRKRSVSSKPLSPPPAEPLPPLPILLHGFECHGNKRDTVDYERRMQGLVAALQLENVAD